jgi:hypothetical protein
VPGDDVYSAKEDVVWRPRKTSKPPVELQRRHVEALPEPLSIADYGERAYKSTAVNRVRHWTLRRTD